MSMLSLRHPLGIALSLSWGDPGGDVDLGVIST